MTDTKYFEKLRANRPDVAKAFDGLLSNFEATGDADFAALVGRVMATYAAGGDPKRAGVGVKSKDVSANGVPAKYFVPTLASSNRERILYIHGGAWCGGDLQGYSAIAATLAKRASRPVLLIDYRLAPKFPFPSGLEDCNSAYDWLLNNGPEGPESVSSVSVAGDSAGGNLAAALTIRRILSKKSSPSRLALIAATLDMGTSTYVARHDPLTNNDSGSASLSVYTTDPDAKLNPLVNPICATDDTLTCFPPTLLQASDDEHLMGASQTFALRLISQGIRTVLSGWPLMPHVWHSFLDTIPEADEAITEIAAFLSSSPGTSHAQRNLVG